MGTDKLPKPFRWARALPARPMQFFVDIAVLMLSFGVAYLLRFDFDVPREAQRNAWIQLPMVIAVQFAALGWAGIYAFIWRYVGLAELRAFLLAALVASVPLVLMRLVLPDSLAVWRMPLSVIVVDTILAFGGTVAVRLLRRVLYERYEKERFRQADGETASGAERALLVGAGRAGNMVLREILGRGNLGLQVLGFVDDDDEKAGAVLQGVKVLGRTADLPRLVGELQIQQVVIAIAQASRQEIRRIVEICEPLPAKVRIVPGLYEIVQGNVEISRLRDVQIEDLLGRDPVHLDADALGTLLAGRKVMVTGAGGSIGSELCRQIAAFDPAHLILVERGEPALFGIDAEMRERWPAVRVSPCLADVADEVRMRALFDQHRPQVVVHAAAHKHVPLMECNVLEAVKNNVLATRRLGTIAGETGVDVFVLISTDKAVRPTSVMGASKRAAELVVQDLDRRFAATRYVAVRFGNVLGSAGSVIPIFREQIRKGGPVTVTDPQMQRYFMTIPEAAQLVLQAGAMGEGGEIFVLDMGEPVRIADLAKDMITLSGLRPGEDIEIVFSGVRPGEKLFEELHTDGEDMTKTKHPKIYIGRIAPIAPGTLESSLARLAACAAAEDPAAARALLSQLIPEAQLASPNAEPVPASARRQPVVAPRSSVTEAGSP